jgi:hypothetical protein
MAPEQSSPIDTGVDLRRLSCDAREAAQMIESLYERASTLNVEGREVGWPTPVAWFWEWHNSLETWANRLEALVDPNTE